MDNEEYKIRNTLIQIQNSLTNSKYKFKFLIIMKIDKFYIFFTFLYIIEIPLWFSNNLTFCKKNA